VLDVADDAGHGHLGRDAEFAAPRRAAASPEGVAVDAVVDGEEPAGLYPPRAAVVGDLLGHADAGVDPVRGEALDGADRLEALLVADDRQPAAPGGKHAVQVGAKAIGEVDERRALVAVEVGERPRARAGGGVEPLRPQEESPEATPRGHAGRPRRQDVHRHAVGCDRLWLEERQRRGEAGAVEVGDQREDAGERAADDAAGARFDEQDTPWLPHANRRRAGRYEPAAGVSSREGTEGRSSSPALTARGGLPRGGRDRPRGTSSSAARSG